MPSAEPAHACHRWSHRPCPCPLRPRQLQVPSDIPYLRSSVPNFDDILSNNAQSAYNLGLSTYNPSKTRSSSTTASAREPYMTRIRTTRPHADASGERAHAAASGERDRKLVCRLPPFHVHELNRCWSPPRNNYELHCIDSGCRHCAERPRSCGGACSTWRYP